MTSTYAGVHALVLGASGFVGRWVARRLSGQDAKLSLLVRNREAAEPLFARYQVTGEIVTADLAEPGTVGAIIARHNPDIVFNLAGYGVDPSERDEAMALRMNSHLVTEIAQACAQLRPSSWNGLRLVHAGSALEYGAIHGIVSEDRDPNPTTLYGRTKLAGTVALRHAAQQSGLAAITARLFQIYGPGEHPSRLLPSLIAAALDPAAAPLPLTHGRQRRDFIYLDDAVEGLLRLGAIDKPVHRGYEPGMVVNLGTGNLTEVRDFVRIAANVLGLPESRLQFGRLPTRAEEMEYEAVPINRLELLVGWRPPVRIEESIRGTTSFTQPADWRRG